MDAFPHLPSRHKIRPSDDVSAYEPFNTSHEHRGLGTPTQRRLCDLSEIAALVLSFCCSIAGLICCFHPATAASLQQKYQLIAVGLMLSFMDLCTAKLSTIVFLQLETRWASLLQNYDSIIKKSILGSLLNGRRGSQRWALLLSASLAFPLLSVGSRALLVERLQRKSMLAVANIVSLALLALLTLPLALLSWSTLRSRSCLTT